jgi:2-polyprenyl-3-methyl-5-hydroxy-6-metoxy-1,4-benzoquinol methylase
MTSADMGTHLFSHSHDVDIYRHVAIRNEITKQFQLKLASGHYKLQDFSCPVCGNGNDWFLVGAAKEGFAWNICKLCGLLQNNVRLTDVGLNEFYESGEYHNLCASNGGISREDQFRWNYLASSIVHLDVFRQIGADLSQASVLDIGCGAGTTLLALKDLGAMVAGFDLDREKVEFGQKYVPEIKHGNAFDLAGDFSRFDYITLYGVLEHLFNPRDFLIALRKKIDGDTRVVLLVPNLENCSSYGNSFQDWLHIAHIWYFNSLNLERLLNDVGFQVEYLLPQKYDMTAICRKVSVPIANVTNSFLLSVSAINRCNFEKDPANSAVRAMKVRDQIIKEIHNKNASVVRRIARRAKMGVQWVVTSLR